MPAPTTAQESAAPPRTELQELQYKAGQVTDEVSIAILHIIFKKNSASHKFWDCASKIETSGAIVIKMWEVVT